MPHTNLTAETVAALVNKGEPCIIKISTQGCPPCKAYAPVFESTDTPGVARGSLDVTDDAAFEWMKQQTNKMAVPMTLGFVNGVLAVTHGALNAQQLGQVATHLQGQYREPSNDSDL